MIWDGCAAVAELNDVVADGAAVAVPAADAVDFDDSSAWPAMAPVNTRTPATLAAPAARRAFRAGCGLDRRVVVMDPTIGVEPQEMLGIA